MLNFLRGQFEAASALAVDAPGSEEVAEAMEAGYFGCSSMGEFVIQAQAVRKFGVDFFAKLNRGLMPAVRGFSGGAIVGGLGSSLAVSRVWR